MTKNNYFPAGVSASDGNQHVTAESTREALRKARETILGEYVPFMEELRRLRNPYLDQLSLIRIEL